MRYSLAAIAAFAGLVAANPISNSTLTTITVYTTQEVTVISCASTVQSCPAHSTVVLTSTIIDYTTVCPLTAIPTHLLPSATSSAAPLTAAASSSAAPAPVTSSAAPAVPKITTYATPIAPGTTRTAPVYTTPGSSAAVSSTGAAKPSTATQSMQTFHGAGHKVSGGFAGFVVAAAAFLL